MLPSSQIPHGSKKSEVESSEAAPASLRERKKLATRTALISTARRLFAEKGYENTTLEEICENVEIHITTFFSYFKSKEELAFAHTIENLQRFRDKVAHRPKNVDVTKFWWQFVNEFSLQARTEESALMTSMDSVPALRSRYSSIVREYEEILSHALAEESGVDPVTDLYSRLKAATMLSLLVTGARWYLDVFGEVEVGVDSIRFTQMIMNRFPARSVIESAQRSFEKAVRNKMKKRRLAKPLSRYRKSTRQK